MPRRYRYYIPPVEVIDEIEKEKENEKENEEQRRGHGYGSYWWIILLFIPIILSGSFFKY